MREEYDAARKAWLKAVEMASYSADGATSVTRQRIESLRSEMTRLENEYNQMTSGGPQIIRAIPVDQ